MKIFKKIVLICLLNLAFSCAYKNSKTVDVTIDSNPRGADIFIEGKYYGKTPKLINIEPKNYLVSLNKEGYGSAQLQLESWQTLRSK